MLGIFFLVAIFNLILGYVLGTFFPAGPCAPGAPWKWLRRRKEGEAAEGVSSDDAPTDASGVSVSEPPPPIVERASSHVAAAQPVVDGKPTDEPRTVGSSGSPADPVDEPPARTDWEEVQTALHKVSDRISYVRSIQDKTLAQETVEAFIEMLDGWYSRMSAQLEANDTSPTMDDEESMQLELLVAQLETTLANLKCIDWGEELDAIIERLEKEVRIIDGLRPAGSGATG